jgi:hypothetical protein
MMESFQIMTWPGYLTMFGDMGTYVFQRLDDMFVFFRDNDRKNRISLSYWHEKLDAVDVNSSSKEFSIDKFRKLIKEHVEECTDIDNYDDLEQDKKEDIEPLLEAEDEWSAVMAVRDFDAPWINFYDFWENNCKEYTWHYVFACYAIVWAIEQYDKAKANNEECIVGSSESGKAVQANVRLI